jgi:hypothetical protein
LAGLGLAWLGWVLGRFGTFWDVLRCIASPFSRQVQTCLKQSCQFASYKSRQVQTCLKQSCQFASYKTRQVQSRPWLALSGLGWVLGRFRMFLDVFGRFGMFWDVLYHYFLDKFKIVWNNPVNLHHTKVDNSSE